MCISDYRIVCTGTGARHSVQLFGEVASAEYLGYVANVTVTGTVVGSTVAFLHFQRAAHAPNVASRTPGHNSQTLWFTIATVAIAFAALDLVRTISASFGQRTTVGHRFEFIVNRLRLVRHGHFEVAVFLEGEHRTFRPPDTWYTRRIALGGNQTHSLEYEFHSEYG
jgi:hypothetical protein